MKYFALFVVAASFFAACSGSPEGQQAQTGDAQLVDSTASTADTYLVNTAASTVAWVGTKPTGQHNGTVSLSSGSLKVEGGSLVGGTFVADMKSIDALDLDKATEWHGKLVGHLKSPDFFSVDSFPTAQFDITSVVAKSAPEVKDSVQVTHTITGNLTLKGVSKSISFDAQVSLADGKIVAQTPKVLIDRTEWGIKYNSGKFFSNLKDKMINDQFSFAIRLEAAK